MTAQDEILKEQTRLIVDTALAVAEAAGAMGPTITTGAMANAGAELLARALMASDMPLDNKLRYFDKMIAAVRATVMKAEARGGRQ